MVLQARRLMVRRLEKRFKNILTMNMGSVWETENIVR